MDKMMTSSERFLKSDKLCVSIEILLAKHTHIHIYTMREMRILFKKKRKYHLSREFYRFSGIV
jgi:hypothetical protein